MKPFFRAVGPDFHKNLLVGPFETVNVYPLMCHLLGIKPEVNDGSLENTKHLLLSADESCDPKGGFELIENLFHFHHNCQRKTRAETVSEMLGGKLQSMKR